MKIIDNINNLWGTDLKNNLNENSRLKIAAACFSIYAYEALKEELEKIKSLEFIFTQPSFLPAKATDKIKKEAKEFYIPLKKKSLLIDENKRFLNGEKDFYGTEFEIALKNKLTQKAIAKECAEWIRRKAKFKSNSGTAPMQQFAVIQQNHEKGSAGENNSSTKAYMPVSGFTASDLGYQKDNAVSKYMNCIDEPLMADQYLILFESIWKDSEKLDNVTENICNHIETVYKENPPEKIYFFMLYNIFSEFLEDISEDILPNDMTGYKDSLIWNKLFNFQKDAATGIINKLEKYNGCILADSVGLGKTYTALAVIKYYELRNKSVLVLCPKKLADNWLNFNRNLKTNILFKDRLNYDVLCHTDLLRKRGESFGTQLSRVNWENYDLLVIDESHNFRNNFQYKDKVTRYQQLMNEVIKKGVETKILMLSATPVNNRFNDLKNQLALAYEGNSSKFQNKLNLNRTIESIFARAQTEFNNWSTLPPEKRTAQAILDALDFDFFKLLDSVTIARSRKHIEKFYDTKEIGDFPKRLTPKSHRCPLSDDLNDLITFNGIYKELSKLSLSIYSPFLFILESRIKYYEDKYDTSIDYGSRKKGKLRQADREKSLKALMTTNLLKRLESSVYAFRKTLEYLIEGHTQALDKIKNYKLSGNKSVLDNYAGNLAGLENEDDELSGANDFFAGKKVKIDLADMDLISWQSDLESDLASLIELYDEMKRVGPDKDSKLKHLKSLIKNKINNPINENNRKILIFTAFADTANYLYENIWPDLLGKGVHSAKVTGSDSPRTTLLKGCDFQKLLTFFSPIAKDKELVYPDEPGEIDILIATDCISEGQNLQDCDYLVNYDIHWNPVRIIQRFGRIDRIGSQNKVIQLVNYWPDITLDEYINLKERVENRMVIVDVTATGDDDVLKAQSNDVTYRKEQLKKLQDEVIDIEDLKTGVNITDLGLNDFRMDLLSYIKEGNNLEGLPTGLHAVVRAQPEKGFVPGVIFTLKNRAEAEFKNSFENNRLYPYYLVYIDDSGNIICDYKDAKKLMDLARTGCKNESSSINDLCNLFNEETADGRNMDKYTDLLSRAVNMMIDIKEEQDIDTLFSGGITSATTNSLKGVDDFELISFLVIK